MQKTLRRISAVTALLIALVFVMSALFVIFEADHDCSGDDCRICQAVNTCLNLFDNTTPKPDGAEFGAAVIFALVLAMGAVSAQKFSDSLVTLKVKLSD